MMCNVKKMERKNEYQWDFCEIHEKTQPFADLRPKDTSQKKPFKI